MHQNVTSTVFPECILLHPYMPDTYGIHIHSLTLVHAQPHDHSVLRDPPYHFPDHWYRRRKWKRPKPDPLGNRLHSVVPCTPTKVIPRISRLDCWLCTVQDVFCYSATSSSTSSSDQIRYFSRIIQNVYVFNTDFMYNFNISMSIISRFRNLIIKSNMTWLPASPWLHFSKLLMMLGHAHSFWIENERSILNQSENCLIT